MIITKCRLSLQCMRSQAASANSGMMLNMSTDAALFPISHTGISALFGFATLFLTVTINNCNVVIYTYVYKGCTLSPRPTVVPPVTEDLTLAFKPTGGTGGCFITVRLFRELKILVEC